ncbi:unnamed protein product [Ectocarpus sp. 8 AP-2014]
MNSWATALGSTAVIPFTGANSLHYCCALLCKPISFHFPVHARRRRLPRHTRVSTTAVMPPPFSCRNRLQWTDTSFHIFSLSYIFISFLGPCPTTVLFGFPP